VAVDGAGDVFIADTGNSRVVEVPGGGGARTTVGSGLSGPTGIAVDGAGDVFIGDFSNSQVVEVERSGAPTFSFAATVVFNTSTDSPQSVTVQNIGNQSLDAVAPGLSIGATSFVQVPGSGTPADCTSSFSLQSGASCNLSVSFIPQTTGSIVSAATFTDNALNATAATQSVSLSGTGSLGPLTITASSASMTYGGTPPTITASYSGFVNGDTSSSLTTPPTCSTTATSTSPPGSYPSSCSGAVDSNYTISYVNGTVTVIGPLVSLSSCSVTFPAQIVGTRSSAQTVTLTNAGNASLTMSSITASGDFSQTNTCGTTLSAGANCAISVTFKPTAAGTRTGTLSISDNATGSPQKVALRGRGLVFTVGPHPPVVPPRPPFPVPGRPPLPPTVPLPVSPPGTGTEPVVHSPGLTVISPPPPSVPEPGQPAPPPTVPPTGNLSETGKKNVVRWLGLTVLPLWSPAHQLLLQPLLLL